MPASPRQRKASSAPAPSRLRPAALPVPLSTLIGRLAETADVRGALGSARLVTLTGPGGGGKTRLALAVAQAAAGDFSIAPAWVDLAALADPALVAPALASALGLRTSPGRPALVSVLRAVADSRALLIFDNCEHLLCSCRILVEEVLRGCPNVRILATSREVLGVDGEAAWPVPPLAAPDPRHLPTLPELVDLDAVRLFLDRARSATPQFALTADNAGAVGRICGRLDGIPLAIELAAARTPVLTVEQIADALDDCCRLLVGRQPSAPRRQRTLQATLDWSYQLLTDAEAALFRALSVFGGGCTLAAVTAVAPEPDSETTLDVLGRLVDKSLVGVRADAGVARYELLEIVRQYARRQLDTSAQVTTVRSRHAAWCLDLVEEAASKLVGPDQGSWLRRLEAELDNVREALAWCREAGALSTQLRMVGALWQFCCVRGYYGQGRAWTEAALAAPGSPNQPAQYRAKALHGAGVLAFLQCEYSVATARLEACLALYQQLGDEGGIASTLHFLGGVAREQGNYCWAESLYRQSMARWEGIGDAAGVARCLTYLAFTAWLRTDLEAAAALAEEALSRYRRLGDHEGTASALINLAQAATSREQYATASTLLAESSALSHEVGYREGIAYSLHAQGAIARREGDQPRAIRLLRESLTRHQDLGDRWRMTSVLLELAGCELSAPDFRLTGKLLGCAAAVRAEIGTAPAPCERAEEERIECAARAELGEAAFAEAVAAGRRTPLDAVIAELEEACRPAPDVPDKPARPVSGPPADLQVSALGSEVVSVAGRQLTTADWSYAKPRELLYHLLSSGPAGKAEIGVALWPESSTAELRNAFHATLHHLRRALGDPGWVLFTARRYHINRQQPVRYDVELFAELLGQARSAADPAARVPFLQQAIAVYQGDFLPYSGTAEWAVVRREELRRQYERAVLGLGRLLVEGGRTAEAVPVYQAALAHDPLLEGAHRGLMRCYAQLGEPSRAVRQYEKLRALLQDDMGTAPSPATADLLRRVRQQSS
ncbi:MAG: BTAD domain-containing putative transcriptional regulator [Frankiaceae bacterium]